jgi:hypothetical protein
MSTTRNALQTKEQPYCLEYGCSLFLSNALYMPLNERC